MGNVKANSLMLADTAGMSTIKKSTTEALTLH